MTNKKIKGSVDTDTIIRALAKHPYRWAFVLCMLIHAIFLADNTTNFSIYCFLVQIFVLQALGGVVLFKLYSGKKLKFIAYILAEAGYAGGVFGLFFAYSVSRRKMVYVQAVSLAVVVTAFFIMSKKLKSRSLREQLGALFIMAAGFTLKLSYSLGTALSERQHDLNGILTDDKMQGHIGYIEYIMQNHAIPDGFDLREKWQFCHPPLHHIISALWVSFNEYVLRLDHGHALDTIKTLSLFYVVCIMVIWYKILKKFGLRGKAFFLPFIIINFTPQFVYFSASCNNDTLSTLFIMGALLSTLEWYDSRTLRNILKIALCIGLGMMTKMSAALVAPPVAVIFLIAFVKNIKKEWKPLIGQFAAFGAVCIPLGLWFGIRNYIKWRIPINYVQELPVAPEESSYYIGGHTLMQRLFDFSPYQYSYRNIFFNQDDMHEYVEFNPLIGLLKMSVFNEYIFKGSKSEIFAVLCYILFWLNLAIALFAVFCKVSSLFSKQGAATEKKLFMLMFNITLLAGYYKLALDYPYSFSMNFRYISPVVPIGALFIGLFLNDKQRPSSDEAVMKKSRLWTKTIGIACVVYSVLCFAMIIENCCPAKF